MLMTVCVTWLPLRGSWRRPTLTFATRLTRPSWSTRRLSPSGLKLARYTSLAILLYILHAPEQPQIAQLPPQFLTVLINPWIVVICYACCSTAYGNSFLRCCCVLYMLQHSFKDQPFGLMLYASCVAAQLLRNNFASCCCMLCMQ